MFSKKELNKIKDALPPNGYKLIVEKLHRVSVASVTMVLNYPERYNKAIIDAAVLVIKEYKESIEQQKLEVKEVLSA